MSQNKIQLFLPLLYLLWRANRSWKNDSLRDFILSDNMDTTWKEKEGNLEKYYVE